MEPLSVPSAGVSQAPSPAETGRNIAALSSPAQTGNPI